MEFNTKRVCFRKQSIWCFVALVAPCLERLLRLLSQDVGGRDRTLLRRQRYFFVDEMVVEVDGGGILLCATIIDMAQPRPIDGTEAHGAWLAGGVDVAVCEFEGV